MLLLNYYTLGVSTQQLKNILGGGLKIFRVLCFASTVVRNEHPLVCYLSIHASETVKMLTSIYNTYKW